MSLKKGSKVNRGYATVAVEDGVNYRDIADTMTEAGFQMNHSSARNHIIRVMKKFVDAFVEEWELSVPEEKVAEIAKSPLFQNGIADVLQTIELRRRSQKQRRESE